MASFKSMEPKPLKVYSWGDGVADVRYFTTQIFMPSEIEGLKNASGYVPNALTLDNAVKSLELTMQDAKPGIYFAANPLENTYGKWLIALKRAGWHQVPGCALNRVWGQWSQYKGPGSKVPGAENNAQYKLPWFSSDGQHKWIHAFYCIVPGRKQPIEWDFSSKTRNLKASSGDADMGGPETLGSLWHVNYGGSAAMLNKYRGAPKWCNNFGRLSKSCGIAMGYGLPEVGADLDEEFFTVASQELDKKWPKGWTPFVEYGGHSWATNLAKLEKAPHPTAQMSCPHSLEV
jgi:hypothetical protein